MATSDDARADERWFRGIDDEGPARCEDCLGTGKELTREDFLRAEQWDPSRFRNHAEEIEAARAHAIAPLVPDADATGCSEQGFTEYLRTHSSHSEFGIARND